MRRLLGRNTMRLLACCLVLLAAATTDLYEVLGVPRDADADAVKRAYKRKALETHPDKNLDDPHAEANFLEVQEARRVLSDPDLRAVHDLEVAPD